MTVGEGECQELRGRNSEEAEVTVHRGGDSDRSGGGSGRSEGSNVTGVEVVVTGEEA